MVIIGYIRSRPADLFKHSSSGTSKLMTTSRPLAGSAGGGVGRGSFTRLDLFIFPADLSSFLSPAEKPVRAFSRTLAWYKFVGNPSTIQPVSSGIHLKWSVLIKNDSGLSSRYQKMDDQNYTLIDIHVHVFIYGLLFFCWLRQKTKNCSDLMVSIRMSTITWSSTGCPFFRYFKALAPSLAFGVGYWRRNTRIFTKWIWINKDWKQLLFTSF